MPLGVFIFYRLLWSPACLPQCLKLVQAAQGPFS
jgi:hypothetical protein